MDAASLLNICWVLTSAALVFLMQGGFLCLEAGVTRTKNAINVAFKNIADFGISAAVFWALAYSLMFGDSVGGWFGFTPGTLFYTPAGESAGKDAAFFIFQLMFASTGATIISGATAERLRFLAYVFVTVIFTGIIYPFVGHWAWATDALGEPAGWLNKNGFIDFAGSTVVHSTGGWVALAMLLILGPRSGRYGPDGRPRDIPPSNMPLAMLGTVILVFGWVGFNGGSVLAFDETVPPIIVNTLIGGVGGLNAAMLGLWLSTRVGWVPRTGRIPNVGVMMNGLLAGLVAVTANCHIITTASAFVIGAIGGVLSVVTSYALDRFRIDDAVGAIPVHLTPGIWGTLAVAFFADEGLLGRPVDVAAMAQAQLTGIFATAAWSFVLAFVFLKAVSRFIDFRVSPEDEHAGLNVSEHGARTEMVLLLEAMQEHERTGDLSRPVEEEPFTEIGQVARQYNRVRQSLRHAVGRIQAVFRDLNDGIVTFNERGAVLTLNPAAEQLLGLPATAAAGMPAWDLFMAAHRQGVEARQLEDADPLDLHRTGRVQEIHYFTGGRPAQALELVVSRGKVDTETVYTGLVRDVTRRVETESSRQRLMRKLVKAQNLQLLGLLGRRLAPEVKTLQAIIVGAAELIRSQAPGAAAEVEDVSASATKSMQLLDELDRVNRARPEELPIRDAEAAVRGALASPAAETLLGADGVARLDLRLETAGFHVQAADAHLADILVPLLHNARKASFPGQRVTLRVAPVHLDRPHDGFEVVPAGDWLRLEVGDEGPGIPAAIRERLFEPYTTAPVGPPFDRGEGLGLAMCHGVVKFLRGHVDLRTETGLGTTISVYLPLRRGKAQLQPSPATSALAGSGRVLVLDDEPAQAELARALLTAAGYEVRAVTSVAAATDALREGAFDLALIDLIVSDGLEAINGFTSLSPRLPAGLPVLVTGGDVPPETLGAALRAGARAYVRKPFDFAGLARAVKKERL
jgi:Amt family ammonium transporter